MLTRKYGHSGKRTKSTTTASEDESTANSLLSAHRTALFGEHSAPAQWIFPSSSSDACAECPDVSSPACSTSCCDIMFRSGDFLIRARDGEQAGQILGESSSSSHVIRFQLAHHIIVGKATDMVAVARHSTPKVGMFWTLQT